MAATKSTSSTRAPRKTTAKTTAKAAVKKTAAKATPAKKTSTKPKVKMITSVDSGPGRDTRVFFSDGTNATVDRDSELSKMLTAPEAVAPNMIQITMSGKNIIEAEPVVLDRPTED